MDSSALLSVFILNSIKVFLARAAERVQFREKSTYKKPGAYTAFLLKHLEEFFFPDTNPEEGWLSGSHRVCAWFFFHFFFILSLTFTRSVAPVFGECPQEVLM